jgi:hypothetical protein
LRQHLFAHATDEIRQFTKAIAALQEEYEHEGTPPGHHIVEYDAGRTICGMEIRFRNTGSLCGPGQGIG